jgi:hypothetical protein
MRTALTLVLVAVFIPSCGDDGGGNEPDANVAAPDANTPIDAADIDGNLIDVDADIDIDAGPPPDPSPVVAVSWEWFPEGAACTNQGATGSVVVNTEATDDKDEFFEMTYLGSIPDCNVGDITQNIQVLACPTVGTYDGSVTVTDTDANETTVNFSITGCTNGATP